MWIQQLVRAFGLRLETGVFVRRCCCFVALRGVSADHVFSYLRSRIAGCLFTLQMTWKSFATISTLTRRQLNSAPLPRRLLRKAARQRSFSKQRICSVFHLFSLFLMFCLSLSDTQEETNVNLPAWKMPKNRMSRVKGRGATMGFQLLLGSRGKQHLEL